VKVLAKEKLNIQLQFYENVLVFYAMKWQKLA
jgi:hypothetical protein